MDEVDRERISYALTLLESDVDRAMRQLNVRIWITVVVAWFAFGLGVVNLIGLLKVYQ